MRLKPLFCGSTLQAVPDTQRTAAARQGASLKSAEADSTSNCAKILSLQRLVIIKWLCPYVWILKLILASRKGRSPFWNSLSWNQGTFPETEQIFEWLIKFVRGEVGSLPCKLPERADSSLLIHFWDFATVHQNNKDPFGDFFPCWSCLKMSHATKKKRKNKLVWSRQIKSQELHDLFTHDNVFTGGYLLWGFFWTQVVKSGWWSSYADPMVRSFGNKARGP